MQSHRDKSPGKAREIQIGPATIGDLPTIVALLSDDLLGRGRELVDDLQSYQVAFEAISDDPNHDVLVARSGEEIVGTAQLSFLPNLTYQGSWRAQIEGVRVSRSHRGQGIGERMIRWCLLRARERNCRMLQLTTDRKRPEAVTFYQKLGFVASHVGMKLMLDQENGKDQA